MSNNTLTSLEIERSCLSGLYNNPAVLPDVDVFTKETDFSKKLFQIIYSVIKKQILANKPLDKVLVAQAVIDLKVKTNDEISDVFSFIDALLDKKITDKATVEAFKSLVKL
jgi:replicative DNA helicase